MGSLAAIEVKHGAGGALPAKLIKDAYRASRRGRIILLLDGIDPACVDDLVEPLVRSMRLTIPGLLYVNADDAVSVSAAARQSCSVFVSRTGKLAALGERTGRTRTHSLIEASEMLARLCRPTRMDDLQA